MLTGLEILPSTSPRYGDCDLILFEEVFVALVQRAIAVDCKLVLREIDARPIQ